MMIDTLFVAGSGLSSDDEQLIRSAFDEVSLAMPRPGSCEEALDYLRHKAAAEFPLLILIGPYLDNPFGAARRLHQASPDSHLIFLSADTATHYFDPSLTPVASIGKDWSVAHLAGGTLGSVLSNAAKSARQRLLLRTTLDRINMRLASHSAQDAGEQRRNAASDRFLGSILENARDAIIATNHQGLINTWNRAAEELFGVKEEIAVGSPIQTVANGEWTSQLLEMITRLRSGKPAESRREIVCRRIDGTMVDVELSLAPVREVSGRQIGFSAIVRDITDRKRTEQKIRDSLHEKDVLLKEIHHRVKNNLAVISSLFYLQSTSTSDEQVVKIFQESQDRVRSMALVHETLYHSDSLASVDFAEYAGVLSGQLFRSYTINDNAVRLKTEMQEVRMSIDTAVPCGLILNELIANALKHAFPEGKKGEVCVSLAGKDGRFVMEVTDNGVGIPADLDLEYNRSLGLRLIHSLTRQIHGQFELNRLDPGTRARLTLEVTNGDKQE